MSHEYEQTRRIYYHTEEHGDLYFVPVCSKCGRYVKADETVEVNGLGHLREQPNATCSRCGRVEMLCEGYI